MPSKRAKAHPSNSIQHLRYRTCALLVALILISLLAGSQRQHRVPGGRGTHQAASTPIAKQEIRIAIIRFSKNCLISSQAVSEQEALECCICGCQNLSRSEATYGRPWGAAGPRQRIAYCACNWDSGGPLPHPILVLVRNCMSTYTGFWGLWYIPPARTVVPARYEYRTVEGLTRYL